VVDEDKDYSDFVRRLGNVGNAISIFAGFTLTTLVLVITRFSDQSAFIVQVTLYVLTFLFDLFTFLLAWITNQDLFFMKNIPPFTTGMKICGFLEFFGISLLGLVIPVLFLFFNLTLLFMLSIVTWAVFVASGFVFTMRPVAKARLQQ
jgi:uncharacterized membrane protein